VGAYFNRRFLAQFGCETVPLKRREASVIAGAMLLAIAYSNHFHNGFHFDDSHAIVDNGSPRSLSQIPRYFADTTTFSLLPLNQS
jgi:hypothetical protein